MHDPLVVAFEIKRPWPRKARPRLIDGTPVKGWRYWPALVIVWHREPGGRDAGEVCSWRSRPWHIHHWRIQVPPFQALRRHLLTRCTWCNGPSRKGDHVNVSRQWDGERGPWWRGEQGLFHSDCSAIHSAHGTCVCEHPITQQDGYGPCFRCGHYRPFGMTEESRVRQRVLAQIPVGQRLPPANDQPEEPPCPTAGLPPVDDPNPPQVREIP